MGSAAPSPAPSIPALQLPRPDQAPRVVPKLEPLEDDREPCQVLQVLTPKVEDAHPVVIGSPNAAVGWQDHCLGAGPAPLQADLPTQTPLLDGLLRTSVGQQLIGDAAALSPANAAQHNLSEVGVDVHSEYYRLMRLFLEYTTTRNIPSSSGTAAAAGAARVPTDVDDELSAALARARRRGAKRKKLSKRPSELVRVTGGDFQSFRDRVRRARATYETLRLVLVREEEKGVAVATPQAPEEAKRVRPDMRAATMMMDRGMWINREKRYIGAVPGVYIGDLFMYRIELCVVGLHGQVQGGIDFVPAGSATNGEPVATSIVVSGGYEDDEDTGNVIIYTGHGGRDHNMHIHSADQKLERANLALERSMSYGIEVRVIRGFRFDGSPTGKVYVYDGLYRVVKFWKDVGKSGFTVYKYKLVRIAGQFQMGSMFLKFAEEVKQQLTKPKEVPPAPPPLGYLTLDLSMGKECLPVTLFNDIDQDRDPLSYEYITTPVYPITNSPPLQPNSTYQYGGCQCINNCLLNCSCILKNGGDFPYDAKGTLVMGKPLVYECGPLCRCPPTCRNRATQHGLRHRLEVFRSRETGCWGLRSLDIIRAGSFVCEYTGVVLTEQQTQQTDLLLRNGSRLVYPSMFPTRWVEWGDLAHMNPQHIQAVVPSSSQQLNFSIDVSKARNVGCYLSHSRLPNVFIQLVLYDHYDTCLPHLMVFALENIHPFRELNMDYGIRDDWIVKAPSTP